MGVLIHCVGNWLYDATFGSIENPTVWHQPIRSVLKVNLFIVKLNNIISMIGPIIFNLFYVI